ncbi:MAG: hypothetical protein M0T69_12360 [Deltaproteobacteria bacterium]|nr:hypothetical protein [Deltaproteobacteria bacterium]
MAGAAGGLSPSVYPPWDGNPLVVRERVGSWRTGRLVLRRDLDEDLALCASAAVVMVLGVVPRSVLSLLM